MDKDIIQSIGSVVSLISVCVGVVLSVLNFRKAKEKEAEAKRIEAAKPFIELRQKLYFEALINASIIATKENHSKEEVEKAKKRFLELYWGELSLIEDRAVEKRMIKFAEAENLTKDLTETQKASYRLARTMRDSLAASWGMDKLNIERTSTKSETGDNDKEAVK